MPNECTIITYHYVKKQGYSIELPFKPLFVSEFASQLDALRKKYQFITLQDCIGAVYFGSKIPENALLLTFDDGYLDHYVSVFPILRKKNIQGCFFPCVNSILNGKILNINKLHLLLAAKKDLGGLTKEIFSLLEEYRLEYGLRSDEDYIGAANKKKKYDSLEASFIKNLLQKELDHKVATLILDRLFSKYVSGDQKSLYLEIYMTMEHAREMIQAGMCFGSHGNDHRWFGSLSESEQIEDIEVSADLLRLLGIPSDEWAISYPFGGYNSSTIDIVKARNYKIGLTLDSGKARLSKENSFTLERYDANDQGLL